MADGKNRNGNDRRCSFCGEAVKPTEMLFQGEGGATICSECIEHGHGIIAEETANRKRNSFNITEKDLLKPAQIKAILDDYVIGQDSAKKYLSVAV